MPVKFITFLLILFPFCFLAQVTDSAAFFSDKPIDPYYYPDRALNPGYDFYTVKKIFHQHIDSVTTTNFTGIMTVTFFVNYLGEAGFFSIQAVDAGYKIVSLAPNNALTGLSNHILKTTQRYFSQWVPNHEENGNPVNVRKFYSFRFINGRLSDIFPK